MAAPLETPPRRIRDTNPRAQSRIKVCPECSGPIAQASGCISCVQCGWGRCD
jgi:hypothetical protein